MVEWSARTRPPAKAQKSVVVHTVDFYENSLGNAGSCNGADRRAKWLGWFGVCVMRCALGSITRARTHTHAPVEMVDSLQAQLEGDAKVLGQLLGEKAHVCTSGGALKMLEPLGGLHGEGLAVSVMSWLPGSCFLGWFGGWVSGDLADGCSFREGPQRTLAALRGQEDRQAARLNPQTSGRFNF